VEHDEKAELEKSKQNAVGEDVAEKYRTQETSKKHSGITLFIYIILGFLGVGVFFGVFYLLWNEIQSWMK
jgi:hypothetical protein